MGWGGGVGWCKIYLHLLLRVCGDNTGSPLDVFLPDLISKLKTKNLTLAGGLRPPDPPKSWDPSGPVPPRDGVNIGMGPFLYPPV